VSGTSQGLSIGQVSARTGLSVHALRFYEREGMLIEPVTRLANGRRVYSQGDVDWLADCVRLRSSGMPLAEIREYAALVRGGASTAAGRLALLREHEARLHAQIQGLNDCLDLVTYKIGIYEKLVADGSAGPCDPPGR
jgi:DNA-binding transcriptional MerR regulator